MTDPSDPLVDLEQAVLLPMLDGLAGLVPLGFREAEIVFVRTQAHPWSFDHVSVKAPTDAPRLDDVLDARSSARLLSHLATDLAPHLGERWDGKLSLSRTEDEWILSTNASTELHVSHVYANGRTFDDSVLFELARLRHTIVEKQAAFVDHYGLPDDRWQLEPPEARLHTPRGDLVAALVAVHEGRLLHWSPLVQGPPPALTEPLEALLASGRAPRTMARGRVVVEDPSLAHPLAWLAAEPLGAVAVLLWPAEEGMTLLLALLEP